MTTSRSLDSRVRAIEQRNARVEGDKAWETSGLRRGLITLVTFVIVWLFLSLIGVKDAWMPALVPAAGYWLSTLGLTFFKQRWLSTLRK